MRNKVEQTIIHGPGHLSLYNILIIPFYVSKSKKTFAIKIHSWYDQQYCYQTGKPATTIVLLL